MHILIEAEIVYSPHSQANGQPERVNELVDELFALPQTFTVTSLNEYIADVFDMDETLADVWVEGEVSNFRKYESGHCYFTLKDEDAQIKGVIWRSASARVGELPDDGDKVRVHGRVSTYPQRGEYQIIVDRVRPLGVGDLYQRFEELKQKLSDEGLFDVERKRELPAYPRAIGIVTSADAAAFQDVQNVLRRRYPIVEIVLAPCLVQGDLAPPMIVDSIERLNGYALAGKTLDVILVCRGGGSIEDLWAFNDERVARAIYASRLPVISGVGHETDFTIADFAADVRAPTPSAAAELLTPDIADLLADVKQLKDALALTMTRQISATRERLDGQTRTLSRLSPQSQLDRLRLRLDEWNERLVIQQKGRIAILRERMAGRITALNAANPTAILDRGYALVLHSDTGERVTRAAGTKPGEAITLRLADGEIAARVEDKDTHARYPRTLF